MEICHPHNARTDLAADRPFGIRIRIRSADTFARLLGENWEQTHWYQTRIARDRALRDMRSQHAYSRQGDQPTLVYEAIERS